jgi:ribosomal protein S18 acetylase RimI-like enzyme
VRTRPLNELSARDLRPLLEEESDHWQAELLWDYRDVSSAVASGLDRGALTGFVAQDGARALAYCYYMLDGMRAIVGSLYAAAGSREQGLEEVLLDAVLAEAQRHPGNDRVECQTLFSTAPSADGRFARAGFMSCGRHYLVRPLTGAGAEPLPEGAATVRVRALKREDIGLAARVVHRSHQGSLDAALNLTYATPAQCRSFVETLVLRAGCGRFAGRASFVAEGPDGPVGVLLASHLSRVNGHICQVSVLPEAQGQGIGGTLMLAALRAFREEGLEAASLSVTVGNEPAYGLYRRMGFRLRKPFAAHAWVRPPARIQMPA